MDEVSMDAKFYRDISNMIEDAISAYEELLELYKEKKQALMTRNTDKLSVVDNNIISQVEIINKINNIRDNYCRNNDVAVPIKITELLEMTAQENPDFHEVYEQQKVKIREVADEIALLSKTNVELLKHGLIMSDKMLDIIVSAAVPQTTNYNKQGKNIETSELSISSIVEDA